MMLTYSMPTSTKRLKSIGMHVAKTCELKVKKKKKLLNRKEHLSKQKITHAHRFKCPSAKMIAFWKLIHKVRVTIKT